MLQDVLKAIREDDAYQDCRKQLDDARANRAEALAFYEATDEMIYRAKARRLEIEEKVLLGELRSIVDGIKRRLLGRPLN